MITQVALALVIVAGAGLLMNSMWRIQDVDLGLADVDQMLTFQLALPAAKYQQGEQVVGFYELLSQDLENIPGVEAVGFVNRLPLLGGWNTRVGVWGDPEREVNFVSYRPVTRGYFEAQRDPGSRVPRGHPAPGDSRPANEPSRPAPRAAVRCRDSRVRLRSCRC